MTLKSLPSQPAVRTPETPAKTHSPMGYGLQFAIGFWIASLFFVPPVVVVAAITWAVLNALF